MESAFRWRGKWVWALAGMEYGDSVMISLPKLIGARGLGTSVRLGEVMAIDRDLRPQRADQLS